MVALPLVRRPDRSWDTIPRETSLPHGDEADPDLATLIMASAFAAVYRDVLGKPVPMSLRAILQKVGARRTRRPSAWP